VTAVEAPFVTPVPNDEEAVAIVAAMEALWPKPVASGGLHDRPRSAWKFSGRWWSQPVPVRRARPWM